MERIATDIYTFSELRKGGYVYVDKTGRLLPLVDGSNGKQFFLARPRRFGKSLTVSTLQALFEGRRELFKGLEIEPKWDWSQTWPVIRLDMGSCQAEDAETTNKLLVSSVLREAERLGVSVARWATAGDAFTGLCDAVVRKSPDGRFVLLIDEYDKPLLGHLGKPEVEPFRAALKGFYSVIKTTEGLQRFAFITGVSKFSKVSIFSDLNNLTDLTLSARVATLMGYTHDEVERNFPERLVALAEANGMTREAAFARVLKMYNGYRFHHASESVVNPVSLGRCLMDGEFKSYWYETGTPTVLADEFRRKPLDLSHLTLPESQLGTYEPSNPSLVPLLFQTGYLTIRSMETMGAMRTYTLGFPNEEVRDAFNSSLVNVYTAGDEIELCTAQLACVRALMAHDVAAFMESLDVFFCNIPYNLTDRGGEQIFQAILYTILRFIGVCVETEVVTNRGRVDAVIETVREIYVIEIKLNHTADDALAQIKANGYAEKYRLSGKRVTLLGIGFSAERRTIDGWVAEELENERTI